MCPAVALAQFGMSPDEGALLIAVLVSLLALAGTSESPDRECCQPIYNIYNTNNEAKTKNEETIGENGVVCVERGKTKVTNPFQMVFQGSNPLRRPLPSPSTASRQDDCVQKIRCVHRFYTWYHNCVA